MRQFAALAFLVLMLRGGIATGQELLHFPSLEDNGPGQASTVLDGYLFRAPGADRQPAVVGLHGCSGLPARTADPIAPSYRAWAAEFNQRGYSVLLVDSLRPRGHGEMCSMSGFDVAIYRKRAMDAYGALWFLQAQPFVRGDRIALVGWSQGGGVALSTIGSEGLGRPNQLPQGDYRAAVTFYPGQCDPNRRPSTWSSSIPLMVLLGAEDVWTPAAPCQALVSAAIARRPNIEMQVYPGAYHSFDAPNLTLRELPEYRTRTGVVPIVATDPAARADALVRVPAFLARFLGN
jgi:dienelactone hydrolase